MAGGTKEFSAKVPEEEYDQFKQRFPQYGAVNWFINESLRIFNEECAKETVGIELVHRSINLMLAQNRGANPEL